MNSTVFWICAFIFVIYLFSRKGKKKESAAIPDKINFSIDTNATEVKTVSTYVAGLIHRCTAKDSGLFLAFAIPEPSNKYDKSAIAVYALHSKHIGYIPKDMTAKVRRLVGEGNSAFCVGDIHADKYGKVFSDLIVFGPAPLDMVAQQAADYIEANQYLGIPKYLANLSGKPLRDAILSEYCPQDTPQDTH